MHVGTLKALEFDRIVEAVVRLAQTPSGAARLAHLQPAEDVREVASALANTAETVRFLSGTGQIALRAPAELDAILTALAIEGRALEPQALLGLATYLDSVGAAVNGIRRVRGSFPLLGAIVETAAPFEREAAEIRRKIDASGEVADEASPELKSLRERLRKQRARLRGTLESYLRGKDTAKYLQQQIVTDRNGRYVLVIRAENRTAIPGIVHGSSASGASLFLEPLSTVEINNDIVALEQQEREEVHRILLALTDAFRIRGAELSRTMGAATTLDVLQAKARYSLDIGGIEPRLSIAANERVGGSGGAKPPGEEDGRLELRAARHPLLISRSADERTARPPESNIVPVDILVIPPTRALVITGPNTGGKTVALKTAGLLPLMAQAGLLVPAADGTQIPVFQSVFADIGDEQSIAESLSTFSAHIANVVAMDEALTLPALVLLDEAGGGTDPNEGGALATAIIEHFRRRGAMVVATTHFDALKTYAATTEGVASAGFGFDPHTFAPTYRLHYGSPGSSLAIEIATRLGLPASIIEQARAQRTAREAQLAEHLAKVEREMQGLDHERRLVARERQIVEETQERLRGREQELREREETFRKRLDVRIDERLREARREIDSVVDALKARASSIAADADRRAARLVPTGDIGAARSDARTALDAVAGKLRDAVEPIAPAPPAADGRPPEVGDRVIVGSLGLEGIVQALHEGHADVDVRGKRLRARVEELRVVTAAASIASSPARVRVNVDMAPRGAATSEINVIGANSEEAVGRVERFLDEAVVAELRNLRIIHGYGTGQLRRSITEFLRAHPFVSNFGPAPDNGGVTVVELKE
ncbi:MAG TPA: Smr/MutS family protein [Vicinamibacterales bacterium]|nr:Smr/MutS family protein [Vicinamibacterales bacterium]